MYENVHDLTVAQRYFYNSIVKIAKITEIQFGGRSVAVYGQLSLAHGSVFYTCKLNVDPIVTDDK